MKKQKGQALRAAAQWLLANLPLCHDWTGVIALPPFFLLINTRGKKGAKVGMKMTFYRVLRGKT